MATVWICVLTTVLTCTQIDVQQAQTVDPSAIVAAATTQPSLIVLEDNVSLLCLEGGC